MKRRRLPRKKLVLTRESLVRLTDRRLALAAGAPPESRPISACPTCPSCITCYGTCTC